MNERLTAAELQALNPSPRKEALRKLRETIYSVTPQMVEELISIAESGIEAKDRIAACKLLLEYGFGRPAHVIEAPDGEQMKGAAVQGIVFLPAATEE